ncbi:hypothetical protein CWI36_3185p0010, partial [Hamiltosporidium magnivora]
SINPNLTNNPTNPSLTLETRINRITLKNTKILRFIPLILIIFIGISISSAVGFSRIYDNRHHMHDVVCGGLLGICSGVVMFYLLCKELKVKGSIIKGVNRQLDCKCFKGY